MIKLEYNSPIPEGDIVDAKDSDVRELLRIVLDAGSEYWGSGSGQGWLRFTGDTEKRTQLLLSFNSNHGFFLEYVDSDKMRSVSHGSGNFQKKVVVYLGGDPRVVPEKFFVPREVAWEAVKEFCSTGKRSEKATWGGSQGWDYMWESHPELFERDENTGCIRERRLVK